MNQTNVILDEWQDDLTPSQRPRSKNWHQFFLYFWKNTLCLDLSEPEHALLSRIIWIIKLNLHMKSLVDKHRRWLVLGVTWDGPMTHLHQLDPPKLCAFPGIGRNFGGAWCTRRIYTCGCQGKVFDEELLSCSIFVRRWMLR
jgi:hypothetical protein